MKILHCITGLDVGGAETTLYRLVTNMDPVRFQARVVSLIEPGVMGDRLTKAGVRVDSLGMRRGVPSPAALFRLAGIIRSWQPDVMQTWLYHADLLGLLAMRLACPMGGPKLAWNIRCSYMDLDQYRKTTGWTLKACAALSRFPDAVVTNSESARDFHGRLGYVPKRFEVIPNGFDTDRLCVAPESRAHVRSELDISDSAPVVGLVARFDAMKDHRTFVQSASVVAEAMPDAVFVLAGRGVDEDNVELGQWVDQAGIKDRVHLLGERDDIPQLMAGLDVLVSSSTGESFPNVVGEAMACGVPCAVTDVGDSALLVGDTGAVFSPGDPAGLGAAVIKLLQENSGYPSAMGAAARQRIKERFSISNAIALYSNLYEGM